MPGVAGVRGRGSDVVSEGTFVGTGLVSNKNDTELPNGVAGGVRSSIVGPWTLVVLAVRSESIFN